MTTLFLLADEYRAAAESLADMDLDDQTIADTIEGLTGELTVKATNVAMFIRNIESTAEAIKSAEKQMAERRRTLEKRSESVRVYLQRCMESSGITKIESPHFVLTIKKNPDSVIVDDEKQIPSEFMRQPETPPPAPDKTAIKAAIKSGVDVPGARLECRNRLDIK